MIEYNTDRLFWTLTSVIVGALLLTISVKAFPNAFGTATNHLSGVVRQAGTSGTSLNQAFQNSVNNATKPTTDNNSNVPTDDDLNLQIQDNDDGTGNVLGFKSVAKFDGNTLTIPEYAKVNGKVLKLIRIGNIQWNNTGGFGASIYLKNGQFRFYPGVNLNAQNYTKDKSSISQNTYNQLPDNIKNDYKRDDIRGALQSGALGAFSSIQIKNLILNDSIQEIGSNAFAGCKIQNIKWPNHLTKIWSNAFYGGLNLSNNALHLPNSVDVYQGAWKNDNQGPIDIFGGNNIQQLYIPKSTKFLPPNLITGDELSNGNLKIVHVNSDFYNAHTADYFNPNNPNNVGISANTKYVFDQN